MMALQGSRMKLKSSTHLKTGLTSHVSSKSTVASATQPWTLGAVARPKGNTWSTKKEPAHSTTQNALCGGHIGEFLKAALTSMHVDCVPDGASASWNT